MIEFNFFRFISITLLFNNTTYHMKKRFYSFAFILFVVALPFSLCFAADFPDRKKQIDLEHNAAEGITQLVDSNIVAKDSTTVDSVSTDDTDERVIRTTRGSSKKSKDAYLDRDHCLALEAGFPMSDFDFQYGLTFRTHFLGVFRMFLGINKFSYSTQVDNGGYVYNEETGDYDRVKKLEDKTYSVTTLSYGYWGSFLLTDKIDLVITGGVLIALSQDLSRFSSLGINCSVESGYFFTKQLAAGLMVRGIIPIDDGNFIVAPSAVVKVLF